jgi:hypothetical protein
MRDLTTKRHYRIAPQMLRNALSKAELAQFQLWDRSASPQPLGLRQVESLSSILMAWVAIEGMVNEGVHAIFGRQGPTLEPGQSTHENKLRECLRAKVGAGSLAEWEPLLARMRDARRFRNSLVHYSPHATPAELRWEGHVVGDGFGVGWMVGGPPTSYAEGVAERIDPERAWEFCSVGVLVGAAVYGGLALEPDLGKQMGASQIPPNFLPREPTLDDLMSGIPIYQLERYWRALRVAQQYTEQWWARQPGGRTRPYRFGDDLRRETILTAFEGEPTEEALGEWWDDYCGSLPALAMKTKRIVKNVAGAWSLADPW